MTPIRFCHLELRTTAPAEAASFYEDVLGPGPRVIIELPARARVRGAPSHWLGYLGVNGGDVDALARAMVSRGASRIGPPAMTLLRDPGGAIVALTRGDGTTAPGVVWQHLNATDAASTAAAYAELFGWSLGPTRASRAFGDHRRFAWRAGEASAGSIADVAGRPGVHPHWLFFFGVAALDRSLATARDRGATVIGSMRADDGMYLAVCDDPQGAAFGLMECPG